MISVGVSAYFIALILWSHRMGLGLSPWDPTCLRHSPRDLQGAPGGAATQWRPPMLQNPKSESPWYLKERKPPTETVLWNQGKSYSLYASNKVKYSSLLWVFGFVLFCFVLFFISVLHIYLAWGTTTHPFNLFISYITTLVLFTVLF